MWSNILLNEWRNELINDICFWSCIKNEKIVAWGIIVHIMMSVQRWQCWVWQHVSWLCLEVASHTSNFRADSLTCALGWVIWILWCLRHFEFQLWWCWWKLEEADRNKGNSKHKKMGAMSLWTHSQMGLGIGALGVPELRRIPSGQLEPPGLLLKRGL